MANRKKKKTSEKVKRLPFWADERTKKITGLFFILFGLFLVVALISYMFTWQTDQDKVLKFSWAYFTNEIIVKNNLGKLGAFISHALIYRGFGIASFFLAVVCFDLGWQLFHRKSLKPFLGRLFNSLFVMSALSIVAAFIFRSADFSWGGAFGESVCHWLRHFIGQIGLMLLLITLSISYFIWLFNFNVKEFSFSAFKKSINWKINWEPFKNTIHQFLEDGESANKSTTAASTSTGSKGQQQSLDFHFDDPIPTKAETEPTLKAAPPVTLRPKEFANEDKPIESFERVDAKAIQNEHNNENSDELEIVETHTHAPVPKLSVQEEEKTVLGPYDPELDLSRFKQPLLELLENHHEGGDIEIDRNELEENKNQIITTLLNYKIEITKIRATIGPTVTLYEIVPAPGVRISKIKNLEDDIALSLSALGIRIIAPIPGKGTIGIEVPNKKKQIVSLQEVLKSPKFTHTKMLLPIALGKTIANEVFVADLAKMPHLLVAGATGQGKSVGINTILMSLLYKKHPSQLKFVLIDPKKVELFPYSKLLKHYLAVLPGQEEPIITDTTKVVHTLNSLCIEMDDRYDLLKKARARNIKEYNSKFVDRKLNPEHGHKYLPLIVLVIDEFADLIMTAGKEVEMPIGRLAQLARAIGIHLVIATQRPSVNIITGIIKANFPARLAYKVTSKIDSRTILDAGGAEQLIGRGDMLLTVGGEMIRLQCAFVDTPEVEKVIDFIGDQQGYAEPYYLPEFTGDEATAGKSDLKLSELDVMLEEAALLVARSQSGSTSSIQRKLKLGYNRAGRIMDQLEALGIVGPAEGSKPREVLVNGEVDLMYILDDIKSLG
jgi:S-DNA-T family DNA segregation ATPase FtsK/SpoIIIE